jgi:hypothetical protein
MSGKGMSKKWTPEHFHSSELGEKPENAEELRNQIIPEMGLDAVR